jgi:pimeloyl-ACP methyl ester carboxylesterase
MAFCGCASHEPSPQTSDILTESLSHPLKIESADVPSRYWAVGGFLVHFITNVNEQNKNLAPIIYVHGLGGSLDGFFDLIKIIHHSKLSRPYYALDLPAFGRSVVQNPELTMQDYTAVLQEFIALLGVPKVNLVCHSMGGQVCIDYALKNPGQIQLLTLISPAGVYEKSPFVNGATNHFAGINVGPVDYPHARTIGDLSWYSQEFVHKMFSENPRLLIAVESFRENFHDRIKNLKTKTLILWGREDQIFSYENGLYLKENIENSTLYVLEGADHTPMTTHAALISKLIQKYL